MMPTAMAPCIYATTPCSCFVTYAHAPPPLSGSGMDPLEGHACDQVLCIPVEGRHSGGHGEKACAEHGGRHRWKLDGDLADSHEATPMRAQPGNMWVGLELGVRVLGNFGDLLIGYENHLFASFSVLIMTLVSLLCFSFQDIEVCHEQNVNPNPWLIWNWAKLGLNLSV